MAGLSDRYPFINYFRTTGGLPVSIIRAEVPVEDRKLYPELAFTVLPYSGPDEFPEVAIRKKFAKIEDELGRQFEQFQGIGVGHALGRNNLVVGFYCSVTPPSSMKVRLGLFANDKG